MIKMQKLTAFWERVKGVVEHKEVFSSKGYLFHVTAVQKPSIASGN